MCAEHEPVFYDTTLRDGNQALKHPWNVEEKTVIFEKLVAMGIKIIEVGFPAACEEELQACQQLAACAPDDVVVSVLARATQSDVEKAVRAVEKATHPRINVFLAMNPLGLQYVLKKDIHEVTNMAVESVSLAKRLLPRYGEVEFTIEHFGDCKENLDDVLGAIDQVIQAGADVVNLANTVERTSPFEFIKMVRRVKDRVQDRVRLSVHCHNDLGMATATTLGSFFEGISQLETTINGLGERSGNTNMFEVALALHNAGVRVPLKMDTFYSTACLVSDMSHVPIWEKAPLMGKDCFAQRSGIHQDGANKTNGLNKGQYIAYSPELIGRMDGERLSFTSQSGKVALEKLCLKYGYHLSKEQLLQLMPKAKELACEKGELEATDISNLCLDYA